MAPDGLMRAAMPGKSSSSVEPAWVAIATHTPRRAAWRLASASPQLSHHSKPDCQPVSSVRRPYRPGAEQNSMRDAPAAKVWSHVKFTPDSAQMIEPNRAAPYWKIVVAVAAV